MESLELEVNAQQKKRSASEETIEDFEGEEEDQKKRSCLSIPVPLSRVIIESVVGNVMLKVGSTTEVRVLLVICSLTVVLKCQSIGQVYGKDHGSLRSLGFLAPPSQDLGLRPQMFQ